MRRRDQGQAFPSYIAVVGGLLFLAFAYFAIGQAAVTRNGAQTAADAAALAAAQDARDQLRDSWIEVLSDPTQWDRFLEGKEYIDSPACQRAAFFAAINDAELWGDGCTRGIAGGEGFRVTIRTTGTVGSSLIPGTESQHATATAEALIEPRCRFDAPPEPSQDPTPTAPSDGEAEPEEPEEPEKPEEPEPIEGLVCDGHSWVIDLEDPELPSATDLFRVRLSD
ncbi:pilus assembly protein TadG-related protein [Streptomyces sp. NPDC056525]|uniref:pilus assembly protein TadG-related protein n=1 Tax=unclassified Streptomyces TaxID=2593676 RepID=UPI0036995CA6